ncbi:MAG: PorT family protein [Lewinellaceae bacterium]|nr:PorT family protein [Lewinellaceae bacterium]
MYIRKGAKYQYLNGDVELRLDYIEVPMLAVLRPGGGPLALEIGPQFSFLTKAKTTFMNGPFGEVVTKDEDRNNYEPIDIGLVLGGGLRFEKFLLDLRYTRGFHSVDKTRTIGNTEYGSSARNYNFQVSLGVFF